MRNKLLTLFTVFAFLVPSTALGQSGDASWLENMGGLETAIGRSWMAPLIFEEVQTHTEYNAEGTPVSEISLQIEPASTPVVTDAMQTQMLSTLIFEYDTEANAEDGLKLFHAAQLDQISRDPRNPATNEFEPDLDADMAFGNEGVYEAIDFDGASGEMAVVYVLARDGNLIYQVFGVFMPGQHIELATSIASMMIDAEVGEDTAVYDMGGESAGGLWEKLNAIDIAMPEDTYVADLEIYPPPDDAVLGDSIVMPVIDLDDLAAVPGLTGSWHITYAPDDGGVMVSTPNVLPEGVFNIELWVMEFNDSTYATASAISLNARLTEPLGIISTEGGGFSSDGRDSMTMVSTGFVRDRSIPEGDAAVVVVADGSTVYAARVYSNGPAPTPLADGIIDSMIAAEPGDNGMWDLFPQSGDDLLHGLEPVIVRNEDPLKPVSTPTG